MIRDGMWKRKGPNVEDDKDERLANELVALGALWMILDHYNGATVHGFGNGADLLFEFDFLKSKYRLTVELIE